MLPNILFMDEAEFTSNHTTYLCKKYILLGTSKFTLGTTKSFPIIIFKWSMVWSTRQQPAWSTCYQGIFNSSVWQKFSGRWFTAAVAVCPLANMWINVATSWQSTATFQQSGTRTFEQKAWRKLKMRKLTSGLACSVTWYKNTQFLSVGLHEVEGE